MCFIRYIFYAILGVLGIIQFLQGHLFLKNDLISFLWLLSMCWHNGSHWLFRWWIWDMSLASSTGLFDAVENVRAGALRDWEHKTVFLWDQRAVATLCRALHSADIDTEHWDQSGPGHERSIMRTSPASLTVRSGGWRGSQVWCQCRVSGCPLPPPGDPDLGEAGARDPVLAAVEVPGLAEAARPRLPSPGPASVEDSGLSLLAPQTPFLQPDKYQGEAGPRQ